MNLCYFTCVGLAHMMSLEAVQVTRAKQLLLAISYSFRSFHGALDLMKSCYNPFVCHEFSMIELPMYLT